MYHCSGGLCRWTKRFSTALSKIVVVMFVFNLPARRLILIFPVFSFLSVLPYHGCVIGHVEGGGGGGMSIIRAPRHGETKGCTLPLHKE